MAEDTATLSSQEVRDLVLTILEGIAAAEDGHLPRDSWSDEMRAWSVMLLDRLEGGGA
jgi:hypothetical protein